MVLPVADRRVLQELVTPVLAQPLETDVLDDVTLETQHIPSQLNVTWYVVVVVVVLCC